MISASPFSQKISFGSANDDGFLRALKFYYARLSHAEAFQYAGAALLPNGKTSIFQRALGVKLLRKAGIEAGRHAKDFSEARSFDDLLAVTENIGRQIKGLGAIWSYDTALRIAFHMGTTYFPSWVYLNRRSKKGLVTLYGPQLPFRQKLSKDAFPRKLKRMEPFEIEWLLRDPASLSTTRS